MEANIITQLTIQAVSLVITIGSVVFLTGKRAGKADAQEASSKQRDDEIIERLDLIDKRLSIIEHRAHVAEISAAELRVTLVGQSGNNGLNSIVKSLEQRLRDLEKSSH